MKLVYNVIIVKKASAILAHKKGKTDNFRRLCLTYSFYPRALVTEYFIFYAKICTKNKTFRKFHWKLKETLVSRTYSSNGPKCTYH